jgi:nucleoside-diphosphate-sugar epimerase
MTTLVTGAGLVGTSFGQWAARRGEEVVFYDPQPRDEFLKIKMGSAKYQVARADVRDLPGLIAAIQRHKINTVVHSAGLIGKRVDESLYNAFAVNVGGTANVAEAVRLTGIKRLVHISTFGVYDWRQEATGPVTESFPRDGGGSYGNFKVAKEVVLEAYARQHGIELIMIRPANVFGLGHFWSGSGGGQKMQALIEGGLRGETAVIPRDQTMANEYIYAKDLGELIDKAATAPMPKASVFNAGSGKLVPFDEVVAVAQKVIPGLRFEIGGGKDPRVRGQPTDISAAEKHLGWKPHHTLEEAIRDYVADVKAVGLDNLGRVAR